ncbi:Emp24 gp25L p24 domain containing protein [Aphelenchoides fujianensis]|nr:Emp24 gp25L p24 domain containing protein [Aphelenchoides fujianensis]
MRSLLLLALLPLLADGFYITLDSKEEACFFERLLLGGKVAVSFEVYEGGFLDVDFWVFDPNNRSLYKGERETSGQYTFVAETGGIHTVCFGNKFSSLTPKGILFKLEAKQPEAKAFVNGVEQKAADAVDDVKLSEMLTDLSGQLRGVKATQEYLQVRHRTHQKINQSTNTRVTLWALWQAVLMISMSVGQLWWLKRFFELRRIV